MGGTQSQFPILIPSLSKVLKEYTKTRKKNTKIYPNIHEN